MTTTRIVAFTLALCAIAGIEQRALADCAVPATYTILSEPDNTIVVCVPIYGDECPEAGDVLREDIDTGDVVRLHQDCGTYEAEGSPTSCYIDECVPQGSYRYGYETPLTCETACYADYYGDVSVPDPLDSCTRTLGTTAPEPYPNPPPWDGRGQEACRYSSPYDDHSYPDPSYDAGTDAHPPYDAGSDTGSPVDDGDATGCGCSIPPGPTCAVFLMNAVALLLGLLLMRLRRK